MGVSFVNSLAVALPATIIPIMIAAFAAYSFTFMQFKGRDTLFIIVVGLLVVPNQVALVPLLQFYGKHRSHRDLPGGLARAHRLRDAAGHLHPAQLHGDPAHVGDRVGQDRRRQPLRDVLAADRSR